MSNQKIQTLKGFRDFLPAEALKRKAVIDRIISVFERFGFAFSQTNGLEQFNFPPSL